MLQLYSRSPSPPLPPPLNNCQQLTDMLCCAGDVITAKLPMIVRAETIQDNRPEFQGLKVGGDLHDKNNSDK